MQASMIFNIPVYGTMSHAYVTAFSSLDDAEHYTIGGVDIKAVSLEIRAELKVKTHEGELAAFIMYARAFPNNFKALIDTYNTLESGLLNTVIVGKVLHRAGVKDIGIRLDSGDLCSYSKKCR